MYGFSKIIRFLLCFCSITVFILPVNAGELASAANEGERGDIAYGVDIRVFGDVDLKDAKSVIDLWTREVGKRIGLNTESHILKDRGSIIKNIKSGKLDLLTTSSLEYLRITMDAETKIAFGGIKGEKKTVKYMLLARSNIEFSGIEDLRGKKIAVKKGDETGLLFLNTQLLKNGQEEAEKCFSAVSKKKKFSQAILAVFFGQVDACIVPDRVFKTMVELNPQVGKRLGVICSSPEIVEIVSFFCNDIDAKTKEIIRRFALTMGETASGRQILMLFKLDRVVAIKKSDLDPLKTILKEYDDLKRKYKAPKSFAKATR